MPQILACQMFSGMEPVPFGTRCRCAAGSAGILPAWAVIGKMCRLEAGAPDVWVGGTPTLSSLHSLRSLRLDDSFFSFFSPDFETQMTAFGNFKRAREWVVGVARFAEIIRIDPDR